MQFAFLRFKIICYNPTRPFSSGKNQMQSNQLLETWQINNRVNLYLLEAIAPENLQSALASKGRNAGEQFAHIHNVRLMWLKQAAPELHENQIKIEKENAGDKDLLKNALADSAAAIGQMLLMAIEKDGKIKGFKPHATAFLGYLISHEAHHRSQAILALKQSGCAVDKKVLFGIWEWGVR
ncbi:MAG TPA: DinB family protein [Pyrinomonadaceae bacterium]|nr:DinB family protein [Pyrinomonadaceae bacterium]